MPVPYHDGMTAPPGTAVIVQLRIVPNIFNVWKTHHGSRQLRFPWTNLRAKPGEIQQ